MNLSIVIPAFNEEKELPDCLASVRAAVAACSADAEVIVTDNNSTDRTSDIAREAGANVVFEPHNQISRARNAGAAEATGEWLLFIDADSRLHPDTLTELLAVIDTGTVTGGGCVVDIGSRRWDVRLLVRGCNGLSRTMRWAAGSFVFCRTDLFRELEGFSLELYASEEIDFSRRLKKLAKGFGLKVRILRGHPHLSSARKMHLYTTREMFAFLGRCILHPKKSLGSRDALDFFYDGRR